MSLIEFIYNNKTTFVQCNPDEIIKDIVKKFLDKVKIKHEQVFFLYNGQMLIQDSPFNKVASQADNTRKQMTIIVNDKITNIDKPTLKKSKYIICPECKENIKISIYNQRVFLSKCKNGHKFDDILIKDLENTQYIDESKIKCDKCSMTKNKAYNNDFYFCFSCKSNLCPLHKMNHDKAHHIIDYTEKDFICKNHYDNYNAFCKDCKKDLCSLCENKHKEHKILSYGSLMPNKDDLEERINKLGELIMKFKENVNKIIQKLDNTLQNIEAFLNIYTNIINNFENKKKNFLILRNINKIRECGQSLICNLIDIVDEMDINTKFNLIMEISDKKDLRDERIQKGNNDLRKGNNTITEFNPSYNDFNDFTIEKLKILKEFPISKDIERLMVLNDGRLLCYFNNKDKKLSNICVYNINKNNKGIICEISYDLEIEEILDIIQMDNKRIILLGKKQIETLEIKEKFLYKIKVYDYEYSKMKKLSNSKILFINNSCEDAEIYLFDKGKIIPKGHIIEVSIQIINKLTILEVCSIDENKVAIYYKKEGIITGYNAFLSFFNISNKENNQIKLGDYQNGNKMFLADNKIILFKNYKLFLIDINTRKILYTLRYNLDEFSIILLSSKRFLIKKFSYMSILEILPDKINIKEEKDVYSFFDINSIVKYGGNRLVGIQFNSIIVIL